MNKFLVTVVMEIEARDLDTAVKYADQVVYTAIADDSDEDYDGSSVDNWRIDEDATEGVL